MMKVPGVGDVMLKYIFGRLHTPVINSERPNGRQSPTWCLGHYFQR
jgi:hypothetical protein